MVIISTAWRNIWRQKRRTILTIIAMSITSALLIFSLSMQIGSYKMMIDSSLKLNGGFARIQNQQYEDSPSIRYTVNDVTQIKKQLTQHYKNLTIGAKAMSYGVFDSDKRSLGAQIIGVEPKFEKKHAVIPNKIISGHFISSKAKNEIVLGVNLAKNLKVKVGQKVVFLGADKQGSIAVDNFTIVGLFKTGQKEIDNNVAIISLQYFQQLLNLPNQAHQLYLVTDSFQKLSQWVPNINQLIGVQKKLTTLDWKKISPGIYNAIRLDLSTAIPIYLSLIIIVCFGFMNAMYMSVYERTKEFGMLMAIGMRPTLIARMLFWETLFILIIGFIVGILLGASITYYFVVNGIFFEGTEAIYEQFGLPPRIYPILASYTLLPAPALISLLTLFVTIFPMIKITKMNIVSSMRAVK